jgi:hypothetical protein
MLQLRTENRPGTCASGARGARCLHNRNNAVAARREIKTLPHLVLAGVERLALDLVRVDGSLLAGSPKKCEVLELQGRTNTSNSQQLPLCHSPSCPCAASGNPIPPLQRLLRKEQPPCRPRARRCALLLYAPQAFSCMRDPSDGKDAPQTHHRCFILGGTWNCGYQRSRMSVTFDRKKKPELRNLLLRA